MELVNKEEQETTYTLKITEKELGTIIGAVGSGTSIRIEDVCEEKNIKHLSRKEEIDFYNGLLDLI